MGLVDDVSANVPATCLVNRAQAQGCSVNLAGSPRPHMLIGMDCQDLGLSQNIRCDFIFVSDDGNWVAPMELKQGKIRATEVVRQLRAGARFADQVVPKNTEVNFLPVAVHGGKVHRIERRSLQRKASQIQFRGKPEIVKLIKCGRPLAGALRASRRRA